LNIFNSWHIDKEWTLFLDRDGVINYEKSNDYITSVDNFKFIEGAIEAITEFSKLFGRIIIVTNQQGIGKGLMTEQDFEEITTYMLEEITAAGGKVDSVYHSPYLTELNHEMQKPRTGMGIQAKKDFPEIDFQKSVMIGNSERDMVFGKTLKMKCVFIGKQVDIFQYDEVADGIYKLI
jgi:histidinol-phosphate phosphatase family protein